MRRLFLLAAFLLFVSSVSAQTTYDGITIPATHPSLWQTSGNAAQISTWCTNHPFTPGGTDYLGMAFHDLCTGTTTYTATWYAWASAYSMTVVGTACDACRWDGESLVVGFDWEYNNLSSGQRSTLISAYNTWISHWQTQCWGGVIAEDSCTISTFGNMSQDNYYWGYSRNELEWGITSFNDQNATAKTFLDDALTTRENNVFVPSATAGAAGGISQEGSQYGRYEPWYTLIPWVSANLLGRDMYGEANPYWKMQVMYLAYSTSQEQVEKIVGGTDQNAKYWEIFTFNDDQFFGQGGGGGTANAPFSGEDGSGGYWSDPMDIWANYFSGINIGRYAKQWLTTTGLSTHANHVNAVDNSGSVSPLAFSNLPLDFYGTGSQYFYGHSAWGATGTTDFMWQLGGAISPGPVGHFHFDMGDWQIRRNGSTGTTAYYLSRETVSYAGNYTAYRNPQKWAATTGYALGARVVPATANGYDYQQVASACTSGGSAPTWPMTPMLSTVSDGTCTWWLNSNNYYEKDTAATADLTVHNGLLMNGQGLAVQPSVSAPTVYRLESATNYAYSDTDITGMYTDANAQYYPWRNNPSAGHVEREFIFVRPLETMVILDRLVSSAVSGSGYSLTSSQIEKTFIAHCEVNWTLEDATHETCANGNQVLRDTTLEPTSFTQQVVNESSCPNAQSACNTDGQYRLELTSSGAAQQYFLNVLQARDSSASNLTASVVDSNSGSQTSGTFTVTLHPATGSDTTIVFNKTSCATGPGQCSSGGTINVAAGGAVSLLTSVEGISYTNNGPVWAGAGGTSTTGYSPASLTFPNQIPNTSSATKTFTMTSTGSASVTSISIAMQTGTQFSEMNNCGSTLTSTSTCTITVTFTPTSLGTKSDNVVVTSSAASSPDSLAVRGIGAFPFVGSAASSGTSMSGKTVIN